MLKYDVLSEDRLKDINTLWNKELAKPFPIRERILQQNIFQDHNLLLSGSWMAVDEASNAVVGFVVSKLWQDVVPGVDLSDKTGRIQVLLVDRDFRLQGIGGELLARAEGALHQKGVTQISLGDDFHCRMFPGVPQPFADVKQWFEKKGYQVSGTIHDLWKEYTDDTLEALPEYAGLTFRAALPHEGERVIDFMRHCFPGRWEYQTIQYWRQKEGNGREFIIVEKDQEIIGFCRINDSQSPILAQNIYWAPLFSSELGGVGPLGIDEKYRGKGYGLAVVQAGIYYLLQRGIREIVIDTTAYIDFYGKLGYKVWKSYNRFNKTVS